MLEEGRGQMRKFDDDDDDGRFAIGVAALEGAEKTRDGIEGAKRLGLNGLDDERSSEPV